MNFEVSDKVGKLTKKPRIEEGYYAGILKEVKPRAKEDGTPIEGKYGRQVILLFEVYKKDTSEQIIYEGTPLVMAKIAYSEYKNDDGIYKTAFTKNSAITKIFEALGWTFNPGKKLNTDDFIGKWVKLNIDDYEADRESEEPYMASSIKDIKPLENNNLPSKKDDNVAHQKVLADKMRVITQDYADGNITEEGYTLAVEQLEKEGFKIKK
jgi:hypothetical protein